MDTSMQQDHLELEELLRMRDVSIDHIFGIFNNKHGEYYKLKENKFKMYDTSWEIEDYKVTCWDLFA